MKRHQQSLVEYPSSDEESETKLSNSNQPPPTKKRRLPPISSSIIPPLPVDNPALHQGRTRTVPHVEGQFATHVYVSLALRRQSSLYILLQDILRDAKEDVATVHGIWSTGDDTKSRPELHISLSRPIFLRAHQREDLKGAVKNVARAQKPFTISFATISELINDEKTRTFLTIEVGAGFHELSNFSNALAPALRAIRQQEYYVNPRFHTSIAWALLHRGGGDKSLVPTVVDSICTPCHTAEELPTSANTNLGANIAHPYPTISQFPPQMIISLNERYGQRLSSPGVGAFDVEEVTVKIGKEVTTWRLMGI